jgi:N-acetylglucosamine malate deacetylase 1
MNVLDVAPELKRAGAYPWAASIVARYLGRTVLAVGAHPDDIELGVGGTMALLSRAGVRVVMAIVSVPANYEVRAAEARDSAAILGSELRILVQGACQRMEDMKSYQLVGLLDALVRELRPAAVLTHGPTDFHQDHVTLYHAMLSSQRIAPFDLYSYVPTMTRPVPVRFEPNAYVDISSTIEAKLQAIAAHRSQFHARALPFEFYRDMARLNGRVVGVDYAEALAVNKLVFA